MALSLVLPLAQDIRPVIFWTRQRNLLMAFDTSYTVHHHSCNTGPVLVNSDPVRRGFVDNNVIKSALRKLRERLGTPGRPLTQTQLGDMIGRKLNSVQRYEEDGKVPADILGKLSKIAIEKGDYELADTFRAALVQEIGLDAVWALAWESGRRRRKNHGENIPEYIREIAEEVIDLLAHPSGEREEAEAKYIGIRMTERRKERSRKGNGTDGGER
jgi:hypothetical protein